MRRIVVCCDGTWESALFQTRTVMLTNVTRLANAIKLRDERGSGCEQVSLYLPGLGTGEATLEGALTGALGDGLLDQVRQAYDFLSRNFRAGDEVLLFGFSRGAYLVRLVLALVDLVGILDPKTNLHLFPALFNALCLPIVQGTSRCRRNEARRVELLNEVAPFVEAQKAARPGGFLVKVLGVFECVPLLQLPHFSADPASTSSLTPFSTLDELLEPTVEHVFQALALNERRAPYEAIVFEQELDSVRRGQELVQVWFSGCHGDIGGGYTPHDLSDLSLHWLVDQVAPFVALDFHYLASVSASPSAPLGAASQHEGFHLTSGHERHVPLPLAADLAPSSPASTQYLHPSILRQPRSALPRRLRQALAVAHDAGEVLGRGGLW
ncbi:uncharacterized protein RHOBADRAFT_41774 [Rhodotorula graminis WP1]|uniref:T6SS Phospholipase effector Tle1-like catalytic domain-containing protein n=1 Tax=Rhodotorula graminis (strain WP1) TaxID=578459 RepID=A0A194SE73_RHOGW|nr:uncharacterized protein RHOBADRAFT_41774 [Rhodotorula graminis WP1]KPV77776.1 hypothetical protein RHOBADRAFT_41774 [Rhodotorula graminis WP1]